MILRFWVPGIPVAWERPGRNSRRPGKVIVYTPTRSRSWKEIVGYHVKGAYRKDPLLGAVAVSLVFIFPVPASATAVVRASVDRGEAVPYLGLEDTDNLEKSVLDALQGVLWKNDRQVWDLRARKQLGTVPGVRIEVQATAPSAGRRLPSR